MQDGHMAFLWSVRIMQPCIDSWRFRMAVQVKDFYNAFPNCLALKHLFHGDTLHMGRVRPM